MSRLCEAVVPRLCARRCLVQIPRNALLHKSRSVIKFCDILSIHCFQLARVVFVVFPVPWLRCLCTHPTSCLIAPGSGPMTSFFVATCLLDSANQKHVSSCLISAIFSEHHKCHPADRYFHSGSGAARSAALFCWSLRDASSHC